MKPMLLAALGSAGALALSLAAPLQAQDWHGSSNHGWQSSDRSFSGRTASCRGRREQCGRRRSNGVLVTDWYGDEWAYANNQSWNSDSYNDWWHDEPWRAYPHWMMHNEGCARQWYAGDTLRC